MKKIITIGLVVVLIAGGAFVLANIGNDKIDNNQDNIGNNTDNNNTTTNNQKVVLTVYKSPTCGCCKIWANYAKRRGYTVNVVDTADMDSIRKKYHIPTELGSCHTIIAGDYVVEGHVPVEAIEQMLAQKPNIYGIALPDMPAGSPGMPGTKTGPFEIHSFDNTGKDTGVYLTI